MSLSRLKRYGEGRYMAGIGGTAAPDSGWWHYDDAIYRRVRDILSDHLDDSYHDSETVPSRATAQAAAFADRVAWGSDAFVLRKIHGWDMLRPTERVCARIEARRDELCSSDHRLEPGACRFAYSGTPVCVAVRERRSTSREAGATGRSTTSGPSPYWFPVRWALPARSGEGVVETKAMPGLRFDEPVSINGDETQWLEMPSLPTAELALWTVDPIAGNGRPDGERGGVLSRVGTLWFRD